MSLTGRSRRRPKLAQCLACEPNQASTRCRRALGWGVGLLEFGDVGKCPISIMIRYLGHVLNSHCLSCFCRQCTESTSREGQGHRSAELWRVPCVEGGHLEKSVHGTVVYASGSNGIARCRRF